MEPVVDVQQAYNESLAQLANLNRALEGELEIDLPGFLQDLFKPVDKDSSEV